MKNKIIMVLLFVFILSIGTLMGIRFLAPTEEVSIEDSLIKSMESTKAQVIESIINVSAKINKEFMTSQQVEAEAKEILAIIKPAGEVSNVALDTDEALSKHVINANDGNKHYIITVESAKTETGGETHVIVEVYIDKDYNELMTERQKLEQYFTAMSIQPKVSRCIIGEYDGKMTESEMRSKISDAMTSVRAKQVEAMASEELSSISAFSGNINNFILSNNKKVNMQIAMRYSSYEKKTSIWIGSPLIPVEY